MEKAMDNISDFFLAIIDKEVIDIISTRLPIKST